uniref:Uncharacterized protein n=1 Tax=Anguilla anguilla TaxID=7936 RepID=A0A0E9VK67_ANGAN
MTSGFFLLQCYPGEANLKSV